MKRAKELTIMWEVDVFYIEKEAIDRFSASTAKSRIKDKTYNQQNGSIPLYILINKINMSIRIKFLIIFYFLIFCNFYQSQLVVCETVQTNGYNLKGETAYLQKISKEIQYGCGATWGKEIFYKNIHPNKAINGFILKKWKYNNGYEIYDVCEIQRFELKPGEQSRSFGCDHITQTQPAEFRPYGKFL